MELSGARCPLRLALRPRSTSRFTHVLPREASRRLPPPVNSKKKPIDLFFKVRKPHLPACLARPDLVQVRWQACTSFTAIQRPAFSRLVSKLGRSGQPWLGPFVPRGNQIQEQNVVQGCFSPSLLAHRWGPGEGCVA